MALIRHIEEACDVSRKLAMSASKVKRTNYGKSVSHTKLAVVAQRGIDAALSQARQMTSAHLMNRPLRLHAAS